MFGEGATSESHVFSALGVRSPGVPEIGFRREVGVCARSVPVCGCGEHEHKGSYGSLIDAALEVVGAVLASYILEEKTEKIGVLGTFLSRKPSLV